MATPRKINGEELCEFSARRQQESLDRFHAENARKLASGSVQLPSDITQAYEFADGTLVWWSPSQNKAWIVTDGYARGVCTARSLTAEELAEVNADFAECGEEPIEA